jgi:apolipoprotein N-acyltransferase
MDEGRPPDAPLKAVPCAVWLSAYALVTFLAFPHPVGGRVIDFGLVLAWLSPALLLLGLAQLPPGRAARLGFVASLAAHSAILHWVYVVTVVYGHAAPIAGLFAPIGMAVYIAAVTAIFAGGWARLARAGLASPLAAALWWTALDHLRSFALGGFPWATLGYAQHLNGALLALAPFTGVYGLSFVTVLGGAALAEALPALRARRMPGIRVQVALALVVAAHLPGLLRPAAAESGPTVRVAVLQGNIEQGVKWSRGWYERTLGIYETLTRRAAAEGAQLVVWPETAVPAAIEIDHGDTERFAALARENGVALVVGAVGLERRDGAPPRVYDSAFLVDSAGTFLDRYDKTHLVPFGEFVPFAETLGRFFKALARGIAETSVTPGRAPRALSIPLPGPAPDLTSGVTICYELLFPDLVRRFVRDGAELLVAITNDAWYGRTGAPYQFLAMTAMRSAESRVWTARAANTGVSAFIDGRGRVRSRTRIFERGYLVADVPRRPPPEGGSFYTRHGDWFASACWIGAVGLLLGAARRRRRGVS